MVDLNTNVQLPPIDFSLLNQAGNTTEQQADMIAESYPELSRDEIMSYVEFYNSLGVPVGQDAIDNLVGGNPVLTDPVVVNGIATEVVESLENPWFAPNPFATFFVLFMELEAKLSEIKVEEGLITSTMINLSLDMAEDLAGTIKALYESQAQQAIVSGIITGIGGAFSAVMGGVGLANPSKAMSYGAIGGGGQAIAGAVDKIVSAKFLRDQALIEWSKTIIEAALKVIQDRGMSSPAEAQRTADEMISQILQKLDKIIDEAYRAHGFQVH